MNPSGASQERDKPRSVSLLLLCAVALIYAACGKPFDIKSKPTIKDVKPNAGATLKSAGEADGVRIQAEAIIDEDYLYDTFEANMILAGVLPVRLEITNTGAEKASLDRGKFELVAQSKAYKMIDSHKAYKRLMSYYGIRIYNKHGYQESREDFDTHAFNLKKDLAPGESRDGLVYFAVPNEVIRGGNLTLVARKVAAGRAKDDAKIELAFK